MLILPTVPSLPLACGQPILFTHPLGFSLAVSASEKAVVTLLLEHGSWSASLCGQVRTKRKSVPHPRTPPALCHPHASSHFCKSQRVSRLSCSWMYAQATQTEDTQMMSDPRTENWLSNHQVPGPSTPSHWHLLYIKSALFAISVSPWPIIFFLNSHGYVFNTFIYTPQPSHKILTFFIGIRLYL